MKSFLVGKSFPIAPITTQTTALANDQLLPPPLPPLPPLPPPPPSPRARDIRSMAIEPEGPSTGNTGTPIDSAVAAEHESCQATAAAATVIAALASECCMQLSREGSGYGGCSGHYVPHTTSTTGC